MDNSQPDPNAHEKVENRPLRSRLAELPIPVLLVTLVGLWVADLRGAYESAFLLLLLNIVCSTLASCFVAYLVARSFLVRRTPELLLLGCGVIAWGAAGLVGVASGIVGGAGGQFDINLLITIHNLCAWLSALCHLTGAAFSLRPKREIPAAGLWLTAAYTLTLAAVGLITVSALAHWTPVFFVQGQGGTLVRLLVLGSATAMFVLSAALLGGLNRRSLSPFVYWYTLALALIAVGLFGIMIESVHAGALSWTGRAAQFLSGVYMLIAALAATRETGTWSISLAPVKQAGRENAFLARFRQQTPLGWALRYGLAVGAVAAGLGLRQALTAWVGPGLSTYLTFYPAVMAGALLGGFGPGLLATALAGLAAAYWVLPPAGFAVEAPVDRLGLVIFTGMGVFMSVVADLYRRHRHKAAAYDREAALRESQARLAAFAEATFEGIVQSEAGRIVDCNEQLAWMLGYSVSELKGVEIASLIALEDRDRVMASIRQGQESSSEHAMLRKDGTRILVEAHGRPVSPGSARRLTVIRDVTERKRAEEALRASEQRFRRFYESGLLGVIFWNMEGVVTDANDKFLNMVGYSREDLTAGRIDWVRMTPPEQRHLDEASAKELKATGINKLPLEKEYIRKDGTRIPILVAGAMLDEARSNGVAFVLDISDRKEAEQALRESEVRYRTLFNTIDAGFCIIKMIFDAQGRPADYRFLEVNAAFERQTGLHEAQGKLMRELAPAHEAHWFETYGRIALTGEPLHFVNEARALNRWYDVYAYRVGAPESRQVAILFNDISALKQAEIELRHRAEELRAANEELTRFNRVTVGRELRIIELKKQVNELRAQLGQPPRYATEPDEEARPVQ